MATKIQLVIENKNDNINYPAEFFKVYKKELSKLLKREMLRYGTLKFNLEVEISFLNFMKLDGMEMDTFFEIKLFHTQAQLVQREVEIENVLDRNINIILNEVEIFQEKNPSWSISKLISVRINIIKIKKRKMENLTETEGQPQNKILKINHNSSSLERKKYCEDCKVEVDIKCWNYHIRTISHKLNVTVPYKENIKFLKQGFEGRIGTFIIETKNE